MKEFNVTGTRHGIIIRCETEGQARRHFHNLFNGESIIFLAERGWEYEYSYRKVRQGADLFSDDMYSEKFWGRKRKRTALFCRHFDPKM